MHRRQRKSRREFLTTVARVGAGAAVTGISGCFPDVGGSWPEVQAACRRSNAGTRAEVYSRVVEVFRADSVIDTASADSKAVKMAGNEEAVRPMLDDLLDSLTDGAADPWRAILPDFHKSMRIGLKVNCLNEMVPTSVALVKALAESLQENLDIDSQQILVWDRRLDELVPPAPRKLFDAEELGVPVIGTVNSASGTGGPGYSEPICGSVAGRIPRLSRILTEMTDVTINCPVLKTHGVSGVTAALKNIYGIIDNPGEYHDNLNVALPALYDLPPIRDHIRLTILDALIAVTTGNTDAPPDTFPGRIIASRDPLALDRYAVDLVNQLRADKELGLPEVEPSVLKWLDNGHELGLGSLQYDLHRLGDESDV